MDSDKKIFSCFPYISLCKRCDPRVGPGHDLNKLGRGLLDDATYQISMLQALWFQTRRFFQCFSYISLCKTCDPRGGPIFGPRGIIWTNLVEVHSMMLHTKYQGSRPCGFRQESSRFERMKHLKTNCFKHSYIDPRKTDTCFAELPCGFIQ